VRGNGELNIKTITTITTTITMRERKKKLKNEERNGTRKNAE
jgi:hypothetical protein